MKDFENDLIYYPNPDPVKEPRFILNSVDELEKSAKYSVTCNLCHNGGRVDGKGREKQDDKI